MKPLLLLLRFILFFMMDFLQRGYKDEVCRPITKALCWSAMLTTEVVDTVLFRFGRVQESVQKPACVKRWSCQKPLFSVLFSVNSQSEPISVGLLHTGARSRFMSSLPLYFRSLAQHTPLP